jgi:hypothetical protein
MSTGAFRAFIRNRDGSCKATNSATEGASASGSHLDPEIPFLHGYPSQPGNQQRHGRVQASQNLFLARHGKCTRRSPDSAGFNFAVTSTNAGRSVASR